MTNACTPELNTLELRETAAAALTCGRALALAASAAVICGVIQRCEVLHARLVRFAGLVTWWPHTGPNPSELRVCSHIGVGWGGGH
jgi:hypothetical protein